MLAAAGKLILRRLDLQNQRLVLLSEAAGSIVLPVPWPRRVGLNGKMLKIAEVLCLPQKHIRQQLSVLDCAKREKVRVLQGAQVVFPRAPLVGREAGFIKGKRRFKQRMGSVDACQASSLIKVRDQLPVVQHAGAERFEALEPQFAAQMFFQPDRKLLSI